MSEIILNLNLPEYQDDFLAETTDSNQLWQQQANRKLVGLLKKMGNDAHRYKTQCQSDSKETHPKLSSYHHAIFISGHAVLGIDFSEKCRSNLESAT
ncbi:hypothetical protein [Dickeya oryzae]